MMSQTFAATAAAAFWLGAGGLASADETVRIRGTIVRTAGDAVTIDTGDAKTVVVHLAPDADVLVARKASLFDVTPGRTVGIVNVGPNGLQDALEVHILPDAMRGKEDGQRPWDIGRRSRLTVGIAGARTESYDGQNVTLTYAGGESTIQVRPNTPVVQLMPGHAGDLVAGAAIFVRAGHPATNGTIAAQDVIVGGKGIRLAM